MDVAVYRKLDPRSFVSHCLASSVRSDGRGPLISRRASLSVGSISTAVGSAMAKLGRTTVVAGVNATVSPPAPGTPDAGSFDVHVQLLPLISGSGFASSFQQRAELKRIGAPDIACLAEFLRENLHHFLDLESLCIEAGSLAWELVLTVYCVDYDGALEDAMLLASWAALRDVSLPTVRLIEEELSNEFSCHKEMGEKKEHAPTENVDEAVLAIASVERTERLKLSDCNLSVSFAVVDNHVLLDPTREEEKISDSKLLFIFRSNGDLRAIHKPGGIPITMERIESCLDIAKSRVHDLVNLLDSPTERV